ncbi:MAG: septal ring lytic transglycosylase RlpA family lipoprotein [Proteobacteria bacterium]|nr:MAG: septal ring lytic transglycosylase RlpA family lipoprotein [Pseudomonadota bacterium]
MPRQTTGARVRRAAIRSLLTIAATTAVVAVAPGASFADSTKSGTSSEARQETGKAARTNLRNAYASLEPTRRAGRSFSGIASYYGNNVGNKTASGQRFNENAMTAAHRHLPFGTKLKVTHGSRSVVVTINDRGPFIRGRVLDLSKGAARAIGLTSRGVGRVVAEVQ